jgi:hypothetical protein
MKIGKDIIIPTRSPYLRALRDTEGQFGCFFFEISVLDLPRGRPFGDGGIYHNREYGGFNPQLFCLKEFNFHENAHERTFTPKP